jgi:hypothetical protein
VTEHLSNEERRALIVDALPWGVAHDATEIARLVDALADPSTWARPRAALEGAVVDAVLGTDHIVPSVVASMPLRAEVPRRTNAPRRRRRLVSTATVIAAAAAIAVIAIVGTALAVRREPDPDFRATLTATAAAPRADASAEMYKTDAGFRVELHVRGLPGLVREEYFQAWLKDPAGAAIPVGTFSSNGDHIVLWSGVSPKEFPAFSVTIETVGRDHALAARRVLVGSIGVA